jgi:hypothetical protein
VTISFSNDHFFNRECQSNIYIQEIFVVSVALKRIFYRLETVTKGWSQWLRKEYSVQEFAACNQYIHEVCNWFSGFYSTAEQVEG